MTSRGKYLFLIRALTFAILLLALLAIPRFGWWSASALIVGSVVVYFWAPRPARPAGSLSYDRVSAVVLPDWLGLIFGSIMCALPVWAAPSMGTSDWVHPMAWLVWPMGLCMASFTVIGWRYECLNFVVTPAHLSIDTGVAKYDIIWDDILGVSPWKRDLPRWMRRLTPILISMGHYTQAGAIVLARESSGISLERKGQKPFVISTDGFETNTQTLMAHMIARDIKIGRGLSHLAPSKRHHKTIGEA
ncbi:hypothetical protein FAP39_09925 [Shimia litoralis]|uniref:Uncharacterized protein n=1 Tax=Shimia litoralis TaxID=420403 RepID=A0A4U7N4A0_9RHOB|nr:hypothetical protein [Shimia litoralis]TKZ20600.1 hypothetical protein FAP39_09925 [Shimia litoralis]